MTLKRTLETNLLVALLCNTEEGELVTYEQMNDKTGTDNQRDRSNLVSAMNIVRDDYGFVFDNVRGEGYRRLANADIPKKAAARKKRMRSQAKSGLRELGCVDAGRLGQNGEMAGYLLGVSYFSFLDYALSAKSERALKSAVENAREALPVNKTIEFFKK